MADSYSANDVLHLEYPENIWRRPSMYLGGRGTQKTIGVREIIDNAVHESIRGFATKVKVTFGSDESVTVQDDGRGLPTDINKKSGMNGIIMTMATLHSGANFNSNVAAGKAGAGLNGVGASATNALSLRFDTIVHKAGKQHTLSFRNGFSGHYDGDGPNAPFTESKDLKVVKDPRPAAEKKEFKTGTTIRLWYNNDRFPDDEKVDIDDLVDRLKYTAYLVPKLKIMVVDENRTYEDGSFYTWEYYSVDGLKEMVESVSNGEALPNTETKGNPFTEKGIYYLETSGSYNEIITNSEGQKVEAERVVTAEVAFRYGTGYDSNMLTFVNTIRTHMGGVHNKALETALVKAFGDRMKSMRGILTAKDTEPNIDDFLEGLTIVLSINVPEPQFKGQQKDELSGPEVRKALTKALTDLFTKFANANENQKILRPMFEKVAQATRNRMAATDAKLAKRKNNQVSSASMPAKLSDCDLTGTEEAELLICEGDSAAGTVKKARDATYQAVLPIRGKILNSVKADTKKILANAEIMDIAKAIGAGFGPEFDIDRIRYGKILFACDADVDGLQISNLLYTVFNRVFPQMIQEGRVYQTVPPLYEVRTGTEKNGTVEYASNDAELRQITNRLEKEGKTFKIDRNKGLGEMEADAFWDTVLDPEKRTLKRITIVDAEKAEEALHLTMGDEADKRKEFMSETFPQAMDSGVVEGYEGGSE